MLLLQANLAQGVIQQIAFGISTGAIYASLALALVLIYRAMDVANFAQGELAMFSTFIAWSMINYWHLPYFAVLVLTILISFGAGVVIERVMIRRFEGAPVLTLVIVTLGLFSIVNGTAGLIWQYIFKAMDSPFPPNPIVVGGVFIATIQDVGVVAVTLAVLGVMFVFFRFTKLGLAMRAASLYPETSRLLGVRTSWMLALGWGMSAAVGAVSGMMVAPIVFLDPNMMQPVLLFAFAGAVLGGIESPVGAVVGSVIVGVLLALLGRYVPGGFNLRTFFALVVIVGVLLLRPSGLFGRAEVRRV
ncbi:MAG TPA: branched-chain amino acid ABC transporter permease [Candidatus Acidoferrales bacterium]|nr:branched-chain amino acid ABC transporter permease [Candidatus Acidoferrales bacterium]